MAMGHIFKTFLLLQSAAFFVFIMYVLKNSTPIYTPQPNLAVRIKEERMFKPMARDSAAVTTNSPMRTHLVPNAVTANKGNQIRGKMSNCTLADINKKPGVMLLTSTNTGYLDLTMNMLLSIKMVGLCVNTTVIAEDQLVYLYLMKRTEGDPAMHVQMTDSEHRISKEIPRRNGKPYYRFMDRRAGYILNFLEQGWEVMFSDSDTFWFRDPFPYFQGDFDISGKTRDFKIRLKRSTYNAGFIYFKPTIATIHFVKKWVDVMKTVYRKRKNFPNDQTTMNSLLKSDQPVQLNIKHQDPELFPWGIPFFTRKWQDEHHSPMVVHAALISGQVKKQKKFKEFGIWPINATSKQLLASVL